MLIINNNMERQIGIRSVFSVITVAILVVTNEFPEPTYKLLLFFLLFLSFDNKDMIGRSYEMFSSP